MVRMCLALVCGLLIACGGDDDGGDDDDDVQEVSTIVDTTIAYTHVCGPGNDSPAVPFTVTGGTPTQLLLIAGQRVETYELQ